MTETGIVDAKLKRLDDLLTFCGAALDFWSSSRDLELPETLRLYSEDAKDDAEAAALVEAVNVLRAAGKRLPAAETWRIEERTPFGLPPVHASKPVSSKGELQDLQEAIRQAGDRLPVAALYRFILEAGGTARICGFDRVNEMARGAWQVVSMPQPAVRRVMLNPANDSEWT